MTKQYLQFKVAEATKEKITIVASDETLDRYNEVVPLDAWDLKNYKKNPVLLVDHDYRVSAIVGRAKNLKVGDKQFTFEPEFHEITQLAQEVQRMVEEGFAPTVSVGFLPHGPKKDGDKGTNELLEISFVAVPANPNALVMQNALKAVKKVEEEEIKKWVEKTGEPEPDEETPEENPKPDMEDIADQASLITELTELKEGRVLSGKTRTKIIECVTAAKQAIAALEELLEATDPNAGKSVDNAKGRQPAEEHKPKAPAKKELSATVRVLQIINAESNKALQQLKQ